MKTTLINLHSYEGADYVLIDRRTRYGNRHRIGAKHPKKPRRITRKDSIELFRKDFEKRIKNDPTYRRDIEKLRGKKIACWCAPLACHGNIYIKYFESTGN